jgi:hypothetical protein
METDPYMELIRRIMAGEEICLPDQVATEEVAGYIVSTIRLPAPIGENCYESALKKGEGNWRVAGRYKTHEEALAGHQGLVAYIRLQVQVLPAFHRNQERKQAYQHRTRKEWSAKTKKKRRT